MRAYCLIREQPCYRREAFLAGLAANGFALATSPPPARPAPGDCLVIWNRYGSNHAHALRFEAAGAAVLVAENGYFGLKDASGAPTHYALALNGHNGSGRWPDRGLDPDVPSALGLVLAPWRGAGEYVLICGQRGIGSPTMASPPEWHRRCAAWLHDLGYPSRLRPHPESKLDKPSPNSLAEDIAGARAVAIWASSAGLQALVAGVPVVYAAPHWIGAPGAAPLAALKGAGIGLRRDDRGRLAALAAAEAAQAPVAEIASGRAIRRLLDLHRAGHA